jgi:DNA-binding IclR family transcriptional regulator
MIKDGKWHSLNELAAQLEVPIAKLTKFSRSLSKQGIIEYQEETTRIKLDPEWKILFLDETFS